MKGRKSLETDAKKEKSEKNQRRTLIAGLVLLALAVLFATLPFVLMAINSHETSKAIDSHEKAVDALKYPAADVALAQAEAYNRDLFQEGAKAIGEAVDPWSGGEETASEKDKRYQETLNIPDDGIMATIYYPRLGIDLPIRHGTGNAVLSDGAGHLYGTSMPVGGINTHAVISAHTGYDRLMFDRLSLGEGRIGDIFYVKVLGRNLAYQVKEITVFDPDDFTHFGINEGKDEVSLLTCTPYGVNNKRMLVTGERVNIPDPAPDPESVPRAHPEHLFIWIVIGVWGLFMLFVWVYMRRRRKKNAQDDAVPDALRDNNNSLEC